MNMEEQKIRNENEKICDQQRNILSQIAEKKLILTKVPDEIYQLQNDFDSLENQRRHNENYLHRMQQNLSLMNKREIDLANRQIRRGQRRLARALTDC